ncbi:MAG TPA: tRNA lysidine(34) synthetase TilS [Patescibacteria group bacterium]|nr:tRNA lysidine(34) synthetase TilS [Patescibacteria group bacterium]
MTDAAQKFASAMTALGADTAMPHIAVAVSGGGDSLALTLLLREWCATRNGTLLALTVDHGLRPESADEAATLHDALQQRGIPHETFVWRGEKPTTHIQERARAARYELLLDRCRRDAIHFLALAHNAEDQMETFWMRLAHGSGLDGLAGMAPKREMDGVTLLRPLLGFSRAELREVCRSHGAAWIDDPSNASEKYLRPRLRGFEDVLAAEGLDAPRLSRVVQKLADASDALRQIASATLAGCATFHDAGHATLDAGGLKAAHPEIQRRVLQRILAHIAPQDYPVPHEQVESLRHSLTEEFTGRTLAGCDIFPAKNGVIFCREYAGLPPPIPLRNDAVWDGRFRAENTPENESLTLGALGEDGLAFLRKYADQNPALEQQLSGYSGRLLRGFPAIRDGQNLVAVPQLSWTAPNAPAGLAHLRLSRIPA